jgi:hypothetical protein
MMKKKEEEMMMMMIDFNREIQDLEQGKMYKYLGTEERIHKEIKNVTEIQE